MAISSGKNVAVFVRNESAYGVPETLATADFIRLTTAQVTNSQLAPIPSPEKTPGRDKHEVFRGRPTTSMTLNALLRGAPTGVTPPPLGRLVENAMGEDPAVVDAASDVTGGDADDIFFFIDGGTGGDNMLRPRLGGAGETQPAVPAAGATPGYKSVVYRLGSKRKSSTLRYQPLEAAATPPGAPAQLVTGWTVDGLTINVDGTGSPATFEFSGPAARTYHGDEDRASGGAGDNVDPPNTVVEDQPLSGLVAKAWFRRHGQSGAFTALPAFRSMTVTLANAIQLRMDEVGSEYSTGVIFIDNRMTTLELSAWAEEDNALWSDIRDGLAAGAPRGYSLFVALGNTEGRRFAFYCPKWWPDLPSGDDADAGISWTITGELLSDKYAESESSFAIGLG